jgi:hypothetical protein
MESEPDDRGKEIDPKPKRRRDESGAVAPLEPGQQDEAIRQQGNDDQGGDDHAL